MDIVLFCLDFNPTDLLLVSYFNISLCLLGNVSRFCRSFTNKAARGLTATKEAFSEKAVQD